MHNEQNLKHDMEKEIVSHATWNRAVEHLDIPQWDNIAQNGFEKDSSRKVKLRWASLCKMLN